MEKGDITLIKFNGKNYTTWAFQFQIYLKGKELWGHIDDSDPKPTDDKLLVKWEVTDWQIMTWILGSVDAQFILNLRPYKTAKEMWHYLKEIYLQENSARRFHLEHEISQFVQGTLSIQDYYSQFTSLWTDYAELIYADLPAASLASIQEIHQTSQRDQFLMKLRPQFENVRSNLMSRVPSPSLESCLAELLREEQRLVTQTALTQNAPQAAPIDVAYVARGKPQARDMSKVKCFCCHKLGHVSTQCNQKFCSYCKTKGHVLPECRTRPQNRAQQQRAYSAHLPEASSPVMPTPPAATSSSTLTPEMVQQMILNAFFALGLSGKPTSSVST